MQELERLRAEVTEKDLLLETMQKTLKANADTVDELMCEAKELAARCAPSSSPAAPVPHCREESAPPTPSLAKLLLAAAPCFLQSQVCLSFLCEESARFPP